MILLFVGLSTYANDSTLSSENSYTKSDFPLSEAFIFNFTNAQGKSRHIFEEYASSINNQWNKSVLGIDPNISSAIAVFDLTNSLLVPPTCLSMNWQFNEGSGSTVSDLESNVADATIVGASWTTRPGGDDALSFDGSGDYIDLGNDPDLQITGDMTIAMWLKPDNFSSRKNPWSKAYGGEGTITQETSGHLNFYWGTAGANASPYTSLQTSSTLSLNTWTHVAFVRDMTNNSVKWYINGVQDVSGTPSMAGSTSSISANIGRGYVSDYAGDIDQIQLFACAKTAAEVLAIYNGVEICTDGIDNDGDGNIDCDDSDCGTTISVRVGNGNDDSEESASGNIDMSSSDLELVDDGNDQTIAMRFLGLAIPQGATIQSAYIEFNADESQSETTNLIFHAEDIDDAPALTSSNNDITDRTTTTASMSWNNIPSWSSNNIYTTPDMASVVQEVVDRAGWNSGADMVIIVSGNGHRTADSYNGNNALAPNLVIRYCQPSTSTFSLEAECAQVGSLWNTVTDNTASNDEYVTITSGNNAYGGAPTSINDRLTFNFNITASDDYYINGRVIGPTGSNNSFWIRVDGGTWEEWHFTSTSSWKWEQFSNTSAFSVGSHTLDIAYREEGALLDKIVISNEATLPIGEGAAASNCSSEICGNSIDDDGDGLVDCNDPECAPIITGVLPTHPSNCPTLNNGSIVVNASGSNLEYSIDGGSTFQSSATFSNLSSASYNVRVRDSVSSCYTDYSSNPVIISDPICGACPNTLTVQVANSFDDAEEADDGSISLTSTDLELVTENTVQQVGIKFNNITIPQGAIISSAFIEFETDETTSGTTSVSFYGEDIDNATSFSSSTNNISARTKTTAKVDWNNIAAWNNESEKQSTPDVKSIIQEIIDRPGWSSGNNLAFVVTGSGVRVAESYDGESSGAPKLTINYAADAAVAGGDQSICTNESATLCGLGGSTYAWSTGATTECIVVSPSSTTTYIVTATTSSGCQDTDDVTVTVEACTACNISLLNYGFGTSCDDPDDLFYDNIIESCIASASNLFPYNGPGSASCDQGVICMASAYNGWEFSFTAGGDVNFSHLKANFLYPINLATAGGSANESTCPATQSYSVEFYLNNVLQYTATGSVPADIFTLETISVPSDWTLAINDVVKVRITGDGSNTDCDLFELANLSVHGCCVTCPSNFANAGADQSICEGSSATLTASGGASYAWSHSAGNTATVSVSPSVTTTYSVTVTDADGCTESDQVVITVHTLPNAGADQTICTGESATLCGIGGATYNWSTGATTECIVVSPSSATTYTVTATAANGCQNIDDVIVTPQTCSSCDESLLNYGFGTDCDDPDDLFYENIIATCISSASDLYPYNGPGSASCDQGIICAAAAYNGWEFTFTAAEDMDFSHLQANFLYPINLATAGGTANENDCPTTHTYTVEFYLNNVLQNTITGSVPADIFTLETISVPSDISLVINDVIKVRITGDGSDTDCDLFELANLSVHGCCTACPSNFADAGSDVEICDGSNSTLVASGGASYIWSHSAGNTASVTVSPSNSTTYTVTVTDSEGCTESDQVLVTVTTITGASAANPSNCPTLDNGSITVSATGSNLEYSCDGGATFQSSNIFSSLLDGSYNIQIRNTATSCIVNHTANPIILSDPSCNEICDNNIDDDGDGDIDCIDGDCEVPSNVSSVEVDPTNAPDYNNGSITITATGSNLEYSIDGGLTYQTSNSFTGLTGGSYSVRVRSGDSGCSIPHPINPRIINPPCSTIVTSQVNHDDDDAEEDGSGDMDLGSSDLELVTDGSSVQQVGMRFTDVSVPQGANITSAYIEFAVDEFNSGSTSVTFHGEATDDASTFTSSDYNISSRTKTTASVDWNNIPAWDTEWAIETSPDLSVIIQEIVDRGGWNDGNDLVIIVTGSGERTAESHDGNNGLAPTLILDYCDAEEICDNGIDDDGDGLTDCDDPDCLGVTGSSVDVPKTISSNTATTITSTLTISADSNIEDINLTNLDISHTYIDDLVISLTSPDGTTVVLLSQPCNAQNNILMDLDDEGLASYPCPPTTGLAYQPINPLSNFDNESAGGVWTLTIQDVYGPEDGGSLNGWGLDITLKCTCPIGFADAGADVAICTGQSTTLTATGGTSYAWSNGAGNTASVTVSPTVNTIYTVTVTDIDGCTETDQVSVSVNSLPIANAGADQVICIGETAVLTASGGTSYVWSDSAGNTASVTVSPTSTKTYTVTVTDGNGCTDTDEVIVTVDEVPIITSVVSQSNNCDTIGLLSFIFTDHPDFDSISFSIDGGLTFPFAGLDSLGYFQIDSLSAGTYSVYAQYIPTSCSTDLGSAIVALSCNPDSFYCNLVNESFDFCQGQLSSGDVSLNDTIISLLPPSDYTLVNGPGSGSLVFNPDGTFNYTNDSSGVYTFTYEVGITNILDTIPPEICNKIKTMTVIYNGPSGVELEVTSKNMTYSYATFNNIQNGQIITITNNYGVYNGPHNNWEFYIDGVFHTVIHTSCSIPILGYTFGDFYVLDYISSVGVQNTMIEEVYCQGEATINVSNLQVDINAGSLQICQGDSTLLTANPAVGQLPYSFLWNTSDTTSSIMVTPLATTLYHVTVTDATGCSDTSVVTILVDSLTATITNTTGPITCTDPAATLTALPGGMTYLWENGQTTQSIAVSSAGQYLVTVTDSNGCVDIASIIVTEDVTNPVASAGSDVDICLGDSTVLIASGGDAFLWSNGLGTTASVTVAPTSTTSYSVTVTNTNGCTDVDQVTVTVNNVPSANAGADQEICNGQSASLTASGGVTYLWSGNAGSTSSISVSPTATTTYIVTVTGANGCTDSDQVVVTVNPLPNANAGADQEICLGQNAILNATGGVSYLWSHSAGSTSNVTVSPLINTTYTVTVTDANGCEDTDQVEVVVNDLPTVTLTLPIDEDCSEDTSLALSGGLPTGGVFSGPGVTGNNFNANVAGVGSHTITYMFTDSNGCENTATDIIQVFEEPNVTLTLDVDSDCVQKDSLILSGGSPVGGTYSGTAVTGNNFNASAAGVGIHTITYSFTTADGCTQTDTDDIEVYALPAVSLTLNDNNACISESSVTLSGGLPSGGTFSGTGVSGTTFDVASAGLGTHTITYTYTDASGCTNSATDDIVVIALPIVSLSLGDDSDCVNNTVLSLSGGTPSGGNYSGTGVSGSNFNAMTAGVGMHEITYTYTDGNGCVDTAIDTITVFGIPSVSLSLPIDEDCVSENTLALSGGLPIGGSFSGPGVSGTNFDASSAGIGTHTITYTYTDENGCANTATDDIVVYDLPSTSLELSDDTACVNESVVNLSGGTPIGGTYGGNAVSGTTFDVAAAGIGIHPITYSYTDGNGCTNVAHDTITVTALPNVVLNLTSTEDCVNNSSLALSGGAPIGGTYSGTGVTGSIFNASTAGLGTHTITYTYTDANGCTNTDTDQITVVNSPSVSLDLSPDEDCISNTSLSLNGGSPSGGTYSGTGVSSNIFNASIAGLGTHAITYTYDTGNGCSSSAVDSITVHPLPSVTFVLPSSDFCFGQTSIALSGGSPTGGTYSGTGVSNGTLNTTITGIGTFTLTYTYTDANGCSNSATDDITVHDYPTVTLNLSDDIDCVSEDTHVLDGGNPSGGTYSGTGVTNGVFDPSAAGVGTHTITYTYTDIYGCTNFATDDIEVQGVPNPTLVLVTDQACVTETSVLLDGGSPTGGVYSGTGVTGNIFNPSVAGVGVHTITYAVTVSGCTSFISDDFTVFAIPNVTLTLTDDQDCYGSTSLTLAGGSPTGGTWSGPGVSGTNFNSTIAGLGSHTITYTYTDANGCINSATDELTVFDLPTVTLNLPDNEACETETTLALSGGSPSGGVFSGTAVTGTNFNPSVAGVGSHVITYTYTDSNGCANYATQIVQVFEQPTVTLNLSTDSACSVETNVTLDGGLPIGGTYSGTAVTGTTFDPSTAGVGQHTITYTYTINGCTDSATQTFEVFDNPNVTLTFSPDEYCYGETDITLAGGSPTGGTYSGPGVSGNTFNTLLAGVGTHTIIYTYVDANGCTASTSDDLVVHDLPSASLTLPTIEACSNETSIALSGGVPSGGVYSGTGVSGTTFDASVAGLGTHTITYTYTDANGCEAVAIDEIVVYPMPNVTFSYEAEHCDQFDGTVTFTFTDQPVITEIEFSLNGGVTWKPAVQDNSITVTYGSLASGTYTLMVQNVNGTCTLNLGTITIGDVAGPTADAGPDVTINAGQSTTLNGSGGSIYSWSPSATLNNTSIYNPIATPSETTTYTLTVSDLHGCTDTDQVTVTVVLPCIAVITDYPYYESFENGLGVWKQNASDDLDWTRQTGATPSSNTGPSSASDRSYYMFVESSSPNFPNKQAILESPCFDLGDHSCAQFTFDYHMYGANMGDLDLEITTDNGLTWTSLWSLSGDQDNSWFTQEIDLFGYLGENIQLRFVGETGLGYAGDMAIDNIEFITSGCGCAETTSPFLLFDLYSDPFPFSIDLDDDGDADMIVGTDSLLFYYQNNGDGTYTDITDTAADPLPNISFKDMTLGFADLDGDGDEDLSIVGDEITNVYFYWNTGTASNAVFTLAGTGGTPPNPIANFDFAGLDGGYYIGWADCTIAYVDLDKDGDFDACMGGKLGWYQYYENMGDETSPNFVQRTGAANPFDGFRALGENEGQGMQYESSPFFVDWDGDGDYDMFSGNQVATIQFFENIGTATNPIFVERTGTDNPLDDILFTEDTHISIIDEDCDGDWDVFYGDGDNNQDADLIMCDLLVATPNQAIANSDLTHYCVGQTIYFSELGTTGEEWTWSGPNGFSSNLQDPTIPSAALVDGGTYYVSVTNEQGCVSIDSVTITVSIASADAGSNQTIELGNTTQLDGTGQGVFYTWTPSTGLSNPNIPNPDANPTQTTTYTLTVTNSTGCNSTDQVTIFVITDECEEEENLFNADFENTTGNNYWIIGTGASDGNFEIGVPYPYIQSGITVMELTPYSGSQDLITGNNNGQDLDGGPSTAQSRDIVLSNIYSSVDISFYYYFAHYTNGDAADYARIYIKDASNDAILSTLVSDTGAGTDRDAVWDQVNGDLSAHIGKTIYIYVEAADLGNGSKVEVGIDDVVVNGTYTTQVDLTLDIDQTCENDTPFTLTGGSPTGGVYSGVGVTGNTFDPAVAGVGTHTIVYTYTTSSGCVASTSDDLVVIDPPSISLNLTLDEACETETYLGLFGGIPTGGVYSGTAVTGNAFDPRLAGVGTHVITYTVTDVNGCSATATDNIVVYGAADIITVTETDATCGVDNGTITINFGDVAGITSIEFSLDGGTTWETAVFDNIGSVTYTSLAAGTYDIWVKDVNEYCIIDIEDATILEYDGPSVNAGPDQNICDGESADITPAVVGGQSPLSYAWSGPSSFSATTLDITVSTPGTYIITVTDANSCFATDAIVISSYTIELENTVTGITCYGDADGQVIASASGGTTPYTYTLSGEGSNGTGIFNNLSAGYYTITLTDNTGCQEILPITIEGPADMVCVQDSCVREITTNWSGGTSGPWSADINDVDVTVSIVHDTNTSVVSSSTSSIFTTNNWFTDNADGDGSLQIGYAWDTTPESSTDDATDDAGTATMTITFSQPVECPVLHLDRLGVAIDETLTNSIILTLTSSGSLVKLAGTGDLIVNSTQIYKIPNTLANISQGEATDFSYDGAAAGSVQVVSATPLTSITFELSGIGVEGSGIDVFEMGISATRCFNVDPTSFYCADNSGSASIYACGGTIPYTFLWDNGETTSTATNLSAGVHNVTITDANGCEEICSVTIVDDNLVMDAGANISFCDTTTNVFTPIITAGTGPFIYSWTGPGGFTSSLENPTISTGGTYTLEVTDASGCTGSDSVEAFVFPCDQTTECYFLDQFNTFSYYGSDGTLDWSAYGWSETGDNNSSASGEIQINNNTVRFSNNGSALPALTRRLDLTNHTSAILSLDVTSAGTLDSLDVWQIEVYDGSTWSTVFTYDGDISGTLNPWLDISAYIDFNTLIRISIVSGFDESGDYVFFDNIRIDVDCYCDGIADAGSGQAICLGDSVQIGEAPTPGYTYLWSPSVSLSDSTLANPIATPTVNTTYYLTVTDSFYCTDTDQVNVVINTNPGAVASNDGPITCIQPTVDITAYPSGITYLWSTGGTTQTINVSAVGIYTVTVTDANGCTDVATSEVLEDINPPTVDLGADVTVCLGESVTITASGGGTYQWNDPDNSTTESIEVSPIIPTTYQVTVTATNGCTASDEIVVNLDELPVIEFNLVDDRACSDETVFPLDDYGIPEGGVFTGVGVVGTNFNPQIAGVGMHTITYTYADENGCINSANAVIEVTDDFILSLVVGSEIDCNGACDGYFTIDVDWDLVGDFNISYIFEGNVVTLGPFATEDSIVVSDLCAGVYSAITIEGINGACVEIYPTSVIITETNVGWEHVTFVNDVSDCDGICNGAFTVDANLGVTGEFNVSYDFEGTTYTVGPYNFAGDILINNLCAGIYTNITIISIDTGCSAVWPDEIEISMPEPDANITQIINDLCNLSEGEVTINVQDGTWPYTITWQSVDGTQSGSQTLNNPGETIIEGLSGGFVYCITVTDSNGCTVN